MATLIRCDKSIRLCYKQSQTIIYKWENLIENGGKWDLQGRGLTREQVVERVGRDLVEHVVQVVFFQQASRLVGQLHRVERQSGQWEGFGDPHPTCNHQSTLSNGTTTWDMMATPGIGIGNRAHGGRAMEQSRQSSLQLMTWTKTVPKFKKCAGLSSVYTDYNFVQYIERNKAFTYMYFVQCIERSIDLCKQVFRA